MSMNTIKITRKVILRYLQCVRSEVGSDVSAMLQSLGVWVWVCTCRNISSAVWGGVCSAELGYGWIWKGPPVNDVTTKSYTFKYTKMCTIFFFFFFINLQDVNVQGSQHIREIREKYFTFFQSGKSQGIW